MTLEDIESGGRAVPLALIGADKALATQVQERLSVLGVLDPPPDGSFGPASLWAMAQFLRKAGTPGKTKLDAEAARAWLAGEGEPLFPLKTPDTLAGRIVRAMQTAGHWLSRHPDCVNIVYIEGMDPDGTRNTDAPNEFNDLRLVLRVNRAGNPEIAEVWEATSEPGKHYTLIEKLDPRGAAQIAFGQYKSWSVGTHVKDSVCRRTLDLSASGAVGLRWQAVVGCQIVWNKSTRRAGARGVARVGRPRCLRILTITGGSLIAAMIFRHRRSWGSAPRRYRRPV